MNIFINYELKKIIKDYDNGKTKLLMQSMAYYHKLNEVLEAWLFYWLFHGYISLIQKIPNK